MTTPCGRQLPRATGAAIAGPFVLRLCFLGCLLCLLPSGCADDAAKQRDAAHEAGPVASELDEAPAWVLRGCASLADSGARLVCGVGSMGATRSATLARSTAIGRARTEIARALQTKLQAMLKDYQSTTGAGMTGEAAEQQVVDVSRQITQLSLSGTELRDTWTSPKGTVFALVVLDLDRFEASLREMESLPPGVREAVADRAPSAFEPREAERPTP